eukprot:Partr_v1_DN28033_c4_g1_i2_m57312 putative Converts alpha-aldose to the beta-anomer. It is active on D-glucose, L-arabinose, D-xylose, D-galactose, maltose and lactose (By similarity)
MQEDMIFDLTSSKATVRIHSIGATVVNWFIAGSDGVTRDVLIGWDSVDGPSDAQKPAFTGAAVGRVANRIAGGRFRLNDRDYQLHCNNGPNHLHGGIDNFSFREWTRVSGDSQHVKLQISSPDGDENYPAAVVFEVTYTLNASALSVAFEARHSPRSPPIETIVNPTLHPYFNLNGGDPSRDILDHEFTTFAVAVLETDDSSIPTGRVIPLADAPVFDFSVSKQFGRDIHRLVDTPQRGYDHFYVLPAGEAKSVRKACVLYSAASNLELVVSTDCPGFQLYTGNWLQGSPSKLLGKSYRNNAGVAIEAHCFPDAINHSMWRDSVLLKPGQVHTSCTIYD